MLVSLTVARKHPVRQIGGKALRLSHVEAAGFPVKRGVVLDVDEVEALEADDERRTRVVRALSQRLDSTRGLAVRSSAIGEDGALSWAGQFATVLFVGVDALDEALRSCAAAGHSEVVEAYARLHGVAVPRLALLVQEMVVARAAGVLFTRNPTGGAQEMVIEAVAGVGEDGVAGRRQPRRYVVNAQLGLMLRQEGAPTPQLTPRELARLVAIGWQLRDLFGAEQDVEWAIEEGTGRIFVNQSRDVTAVTSVGVAEVRARVVADLATTLERERERLEGWRVRLNHPDVLSDQNIAELLTRHPCQMAFGLFTNLFAHGNGAIRAGRNELGYEISDELREGFFRLVAGQPRCSIIHDALTYRIRGIPLSDYGQLIDHYLERIAHEPQLASYPEVQLYNQAPSQEFLKELFGREKGAKYYQAYQRFFSWLREREEVYDTLCHETFIPQWRQLMEHAATKPPTNELAELLWRYEGMTNLLRQEACRAFVKGARIGFFAYARLRQRLHQRYGEEQGEAVLATITSGIPVERNPNLQLSLTLYALKQGRITLEQVVTEFGHLALHELEISVPRYREEPDRLRNLAGQLTEDPRVACQHSVAQSAQVQRMILGEAVTDPEDLARDIGLARRYLPLREVLKFEYLRGYDLLRQTALQIEQVLGWEDGLIFQLNPEEVFALGHSETAPGRLHEVVRERRRRRETERGLYVPPVLFADRLAEVGETPQTTGGRLLRGVGVTHLVTEGEVVVVRHLRDEAALSRLHPGVILVTETTDPAWSPILAIAGSTGGLVTEVGGLLAHGAIYAREMGMAAVLQVPEATKILETGMRVRVNGVQGSVEIL